MENIYASDDLDVRNRPELKDFFEDEEKILFSGVVHKINKHKAVQERILVISTKSIYNICLSGNIIDNISAWLKPKNALKRKISVKKASAITYSVHPKSQQFIIHVEGEYDYRYNGDGQRSKIVETLMRAYFAQVNGLFALYVKDVEDLSAFHTTDDDWKAQVIKKPNLGRINVTPQLLDKGLNFIVDNRDKFISDGNNLNDALRAQSEVRGQGRNSNYGPPDPFLAQSVAPSSTFDWNKPVNTIDDIPMAESGYIPRKNVHNNNI